MNPERHQLCALFPPLSEKRFAMLKEHIRREGQQVPIVLYDGKVLDGWNRLQICSELGIAPRFTNFEGSDPYAYIIGESLRRDLTPAQRAMVIASAAQIMKQGRPKKAGDSSNNEKVSMETFSRSLHELAAEAHVSRTTMQRAEEISRHGTEEEKQKVMSGERGLHRLANEVQKHRRSAPPPTRKPQPKSKPPLTGLRWVSRRARYRDPDKELERALVALDAICSVLAILPFDRLDESQAETRAARLKDFATMINKTARGVRNYDQHTGTPATYIDVRHGEHCGLKH